MRLLTRLIEQFKNADYRRSYVESFGDSYLATQLKVLREQRQLTQEQLASVVGVKQSQVCRWENANNSSWQVRTLKKIASALDLVLIVRFESFGNTLPVIDSFGREALERPSFADDPAFATVVAEAEIDISSPSGEPCATGHYFGSHAAAIFRGTGRFGQGIYSQEAIENVG